VTPVAGRPPDVGWNMTAASGRGLPSSETIPDAGRSTGLAGPHPSKTPRKAITQQGPNGNEARMMRSTVEKPFLDGLAGNQ
jgi:hypothetical protein